MINLGITRADLTNSSWNTLVCSAPFFAGLASAWAVNKLGCWALKIKTDEKRSSDALRMKLFACAIGTAVSLPAISNMPPLVPFSGKKILQFVWLTLLNVGGVIPGFYGQRSLYVIGFTGAFTGAFAIDLISNAKTT